MNWCLVLSPEKVYAEKNRKELYSVDIKDWTPDTIMDAIKQVDYYMNDYGKSHGRD